jgi:hypothetical protein
MDSVAFLALLLPSVQNSREKQILDVNKLIAVESKVT